MVRRGTERGSTVSTKKRQKKAYAAPRVVDFGAIEVMTAGCLGLCLDGEGAGFFGYEP